MKAVITGIRDYHSRNCFTERTEGTPVINYRAVRGDFLTYLTKEVVSGVRGSYVFKYSYRKVFNKSPKVSLPSTPTCSLVMSEEKKTCESYGTRMSHDD